MQSPLGEFSPGGSFRGCWKNSWLRWRPGSVLGLGAPQSLGSGLVAWVPINFGPMTSWRIVRRVRGGFVAGVVSLATAPERGFFPWHLALGTWHLALGTWHLALRTRTMAINMSTPCGDGWRSRNRRLGAVVCVILWCSVLSPAVRIARIATSTWRLRLKAAVPSP